MSFLQPVPPEDMLEEQLRHQVIGTKRHPGLAQSVGFHCYHTVRSDRSAPGYPDWSLFRERHVYLELKRHAKRPADAKLSEPQRDFARRIIAAGVEIYVIRPHDLQDLAVVLAARRPPGGTWSRPGAAEAARRLHDKLLAELA